MMDFVKFGRKVRELRQKAGYTQAELAQKMAVAAAYIGYIENGDKKPALETTVKMANILGVTVDELIN